MVAESRAFQSRGLRRPKANPIMQDFHFRCPRSRQQNFIHPKQPSILKHQSWPRGPAVATKVTFGESLQTEAQMELMVYLANY